MQYAARLLQPPSLKSFAATLAAVAIGAAGAVGAYALIDDDGSVAQEPARVIVVGTPVTGEGVSAKNEAATASAVAGSGLELRGSKASTTSGSGDDAASAAR
jgi:hypothetical protein